ncbi:MAG TPA: cupin domain-containing protein [Bacillota bacterium]|nr:cupin domain-containing protein [Bacillota bacterium]
MAVSYMDFSADDIQFKANLKDNLLFKKDENNYLYDLGIKQLNTIGNISLLDIYLSDGNVLEAHYHQNASELVYCITGSALISMINPDTDELLNFNLTPTEVVSIPQGWWHYFSATSDETHLLSTFDTPILQTIFGSDILRLMPKDALSHMYCLDEEAVKEALDPIDETVIIGPPSDCMDETGGNHVRKAKRNTLPKEDTKTGRPTNLPPFPGALYPKS